MVTAGADINNIGFKITVLFNLFVITNDMFVPNLILGGRFIIKSIDNSC